MNLPQNLTCKTVAGSGLRSCPSRHVKAGVAGRVQGLFVLFGALVLLQGCASRAYRYAPAAPPPLQPPAVNVDPSSGSASRSPQTSQNLPAQVTPPPQQPQPQVHYSSSTQRPGVISRFKSWLRSGRGIAWGSAKQQPRDPALDRIMVETLTSSEPHHSHAPDPKPPRPQATWLFR